jgi:hypothetical protein
MSWVYRRQPQAQYRQKRKLTPTLFVESTPSDDWPTASGDLLLSVMEAASDNEVYHVESVTTGTTTWTHDGTIREIVVLGMSLNSLQTVLTDDVDADDRSVRLPQVPDLVYSNP